MSPNNPTERPPICDYEGSDYQERFWEQGGRAYEDQVEAIALRRLLPPSGDLLLEVGAGAGRNTTRYQGFKQVVLLDYSLSQLEQAQQRLGPNARWIFVAADVYRLPFSQGLFDAATMIRVLHHMVEPERALRQVREAMRSGGTFILEYANKQNLKAISRYLLRRQQWSPFSPEPVEFAPLNYDFHPTTVRRWLHEAEFAIERQLSVSHFRVQFLKRLIPLSILVRLDALFQWTGAWWQLTPSVFVSSSATGESPQAPPAAFFRCPNCGRDLSELPVGTPTADQMKCSACGQLWAIHNGIYDFRQPL